MARKAPKRYKLLCIHNAAPIRFIDKFDYELGIELARLAVVVDECKHLASYCTRLPNPKIKAGIAAIHLIEPQLSATDVPSEICRINCALIDILALLNAVKHSKLPFLQRLRFALTYGQTHRKRDRKGFREDANAEYANETENDQTEDEDAD